MLVTLAVLVIDLVAVSPQNFTINQSGLKKLREVFRQLRPVPRKSKKKENVFVYPDLNTSKSVYLRIGRVKKPIEPPYEGPYQVKKRTKKWFRLDLDRKEDISIDRLKPETLNDCFIVWNYYDFFSSLQKHILVFFTVIFFFQLLPI